MVPSAQRSKRSLPLLVLLFLLPACGGSSSSSSSGPQPGPVDPNTKGLDVLGKGTDVFGAYAVEANVKGQVLDVAALNSANLLVYNPNVEEARYEEMSGHSMSSYASQLAGSVGLSGSYSFFSAEVKVNFANDTYRRDDYSYASIIERYWKHSLRVAPGVWASGTHLRPYLTSLARQAIDDTDSIHGPWSAAQVLAAYGTHVMNGLYVGGRLDYHLAIQILEEQHRTALSAFVKAKYGSTFASAGVTAEISQQTMTAMSAYQKVGPVINAKGGDAQYAHPEDDAQYKLWKASLATNPVFCGIIEGGLLGIWELAPSPQRRQELLTAFEAYAASEAAGFVPIVGRITDVLVLNAGVGTGDKDGHSRPTVTPPTGYELLKSASGDIAGGNLNKDIWNDTVHANYVYVAYRSQVTDAPVGVAQLHLASGNASVDSRIYGAGGHAGVYGAGRPGCTDPDVASVNLNLGTCSQPSRSDYLFCAVYVWDAACNAAGLPLALHYAMEDGANEPIRCIVVGDSVAIDATKPIEERAAHIHWGPWDVNHDGPAGDATVDAKWVVAHTYWVRDFTGQPVNLNLGTRSYWRNNYHCFPWPCCWTGCCGRYDDSDIHDYEGAPDAQYLGVCYLNPPTTP
jgi:hypothetical protein